MKEMRTRKKWRAERTAGCIVLGLLTVGLCLALCGTGRVFGSKVDWISQHSVIADYFRQQFYDTGDLFPEFAANLGGGQNIYHFSYYGLYSPVVLISYLLPFVKMGDYLMAVSVLGLAVSVVLMYCWLLSRGFSGMISFGTAVMFLLAGPMLFHSYSQVMFVNYMPFLCMGFFGADRYFERNKSGLFTVSVFLMIMTSFYFSICGMLVLVLYGLHRYFQTADERGKKVTALVFLKAGIRFAMLMITAVMMSGVLLVPTALSLTGRNVVKEGFSVTELFCPDAQVFRFVYSAYGIGLTTLVITVLLTGLTYRKCYERVLSYGSVIFLFVPVFSWMLNGGLYIRDKVWIPFLPLLCYLIAYYLDKLEREGISFLRGFLPYLLTLGILYLGHDSAGNEKYWKLILLDGIVMAVCFVLFYRKRKILLLMLPPVVFLAVFAGTFHRSADRMVSRETYDRLTDREIGEAIEKTLENEDGFYRMEQMGTGSENGANIDRIWNMGQYVSSVYSSAYHAGYQEFRQNVFGVEEAFRNYLMQQVSRNPLFQRFMGVKYLAVYDDEDGIPGYELCDTAGNIRIYRNENVSPVAYATDRLISREAYEELEFPYNQLALLKYAVVEDKEEASGNMPPEADSIGTDEGVLTDEARLQQLYSSMQPCIRVQLDIPELEADGNRITKTEAGYQISMKEKTTVNTRLKLPKEKNAAGSVLFLQFQVKNKKSSKDVGIWVEKEKNSLSADSHIYYNGNTTFTYAVLLQPGQDEAEIIFGKGDYEISDMQCYLCPGSEEAVQEESRNLYQSEFYPDRKETKGNRIRGKIEVKNDGYFITTIPYETNFEVLADGKEIPYEKVNTAFLGFPVEEGEHDVEIIYHAPGVFWGKMLSLLGLLLWGMMILQSHKNLHRN